MNAEISVVMVMVNGDDGPTGFICGGAFLYKDVQDVLRQNRGTLVSVRLLEPTPDEEPIWDILFAVLQAFPEKRHSVQGLFHHIIDAAFACGRKSE